MVNTPAMAHSEPTILPHTPTGLVFEKRYGRDLNMQAFQGPQNSVMGNITLIDLIKNYVSFTVTYNL